MTKTIVVVGAGKTIGLSVAREFGRHGFNVGLIARSADNLRDLREALATDVVGARVETCLADVTKANELNIALDWMREQFGSIDVLEYSPAIGFQNYKPALDIDTEGARYAFDLLVGGAVTAVRNVLPEMLERKDGALLFTSGGAALNPIPFLANVGLVSAGLRNYLTNLHNALAPQGVYVGAIYVGGVMKRGSEVDPDKIAAKFFEMYSKRDKAEDVVIGPPPPGGPPPKP
ncbi:MAG: SDR family NAD(P)-dependent oxidoreductase [Caulobacteraceae bacterium]|nr:SDR family NAD(P)-dependent oxidoreductase [Caulobacteraceae bacterium]